MTFLVLLDCNSVVRLFRRIMAMVKNVIKSQVSLKHVLNVCMNSCKMIIFQNHNFLWTRTSISCLCPCMTSLTAPIVSRSISTSSVMCRKQAGRYKVTKRHIKPLTYEQSQKPHQIAMTKLQNSQNTSNLLGGNVWTLI